MLKTWRDYNETVNKKLRMFRFNYINASITPLKINMEPTNHPFREENDLPNLDDNVPC